MPILNLGFQKISGWGHVDSIAVSAIVFVLLDFDKKKSDAKIQITLMMQRRNAFSTDRLSQSNLLTTQNYKMTPSLQSHRTFDFGFAIVV